MYFQSKIKSSYNESNEATYSRGYPGLDGTIHGEIKITEDDFIFKDLFFSDKIIFKINIKHIINVTTGFIDASDFTYAMLGPLALSARYKTLQIEYQDGNNIHTVEFYTRSKFLFENIKGKITLYNK